MIKIGIQSDRLIVTDYSNKNPKCVDYYLKMDNPSLDLDSCLTKAYLIRLDADIQKSVSKENRRVEFNILRTDYKK